MLAIVTAQPSAPASLLLDTKIYIYKKKSYIQKGHN